MFSLSNVVAKFYLRLTHTLGVSLAFNLRFVGTRKSLQPQC